MYIAESILQESIKELGLQDFKRIEVGGVISKFMSGDTSDEKRIQYKNNILLYLIESQKLDTKLEIPVLNQCPECNGRGFDVSLFEIEEIPCPLIISTNMLTSKKSYSGCNGTGWKIAECTHCKGTGKDGENPCPICKDPKTGRPRGTYMYKPTKKFQGIKCSTCQGTGKLKKVVQRTTNISSANKCSKCKGSGTFTSIGTSVISPAIAEKLREQISNDTKPPVKKRKTKKETLSA